MTTTDTPPDDSPPDDYDHFAEFVAGLRAAGWTPLPIGPPFAEFLAVRFSRDGTQDSVIVYDLDHVDAHRENPDGTTGWTVQGDLATVRAVLTTHGQWGRKP